jgi:hypothetical protein
LNGFDQDVMALAGGRTIYHNRRMQTMSAGVVLEIGLDGFIAAVAPSEWLQMTGQGSDFPETTGVAENMTGGRLFPRTR